MLQSRIINEVNGNYLLLMTNEENISGYELKMFEYNKIKGFLPISITRINNTITYQYGIMQCESLLRKCGSDPVTIDDIKNIFSEITLLVQRAAEYLLNVDSILLNPEYIFVNGNELLFCYYPSESQSFNRGVRELMEFILERLDHRNQENVMTAYGIYQKILKNNFTMENLMNEFFSENVNGENTGIYVQEEMKEERSTFGNDQEVMGVNSDILSLEGELEEEFVRGNKKDRKRKGKLFSWIHKVNKQQPVNGTMVLAENTSYGNTQILTEKKLENMSGGTDIALAGFPIHIGSSAAEAGCVVKNVMVSRKHAVITMECGGYYIEDLDSTNGTFINGSRIPPYEPILVRDGDQISFANEKFRLN